MTTRVRWLLGVLALGAACGRKQAEEPRPPPGVDAARPAPSVAPPPWAKLPPPGAGQTLALRGGAASIMTGEEARAAGLLDVDLGDEWAPFIFSESDAPGTPPKPNVYRRTFIDLANDRFDPDELQQLGGATRAIDFSPEAVAKRLRDQRLRKQGKEPPPEVPKRRKRTEPVRNFLEVYGIPPTLSVLLARVEEDAGKTCYTGLDVEGLRRWDGLVSYQNQKQAKRDYDEARADAAWYEAQLVAAADAGVAGVSAAGAADAVAAGDAGPLDVLAAADPKLATRLARYRVGQRRLRAIRAAQARLACEGLLSPRSRFVDGMFDLPTHQALAAWERKNDLFGWGFLGDETVVALARPPLDLHFDAWKRIVTERLADAAGIIEDGSVSGGKRPASYKDADGVVRPVPNLIAEHLAALQSQLGVADSAGMERFLRAMKPGLGGLRVAFAPPALPPYYAADMDLEVDIDRGDVWYDFPFDDKGRLTEQRRERFPHLVLFVKWNKQRIPLSRWRTTIGSWRSELQTEDGKVYYKYKNSDVGPRIWKHIVAAPVWIPPDGTPARDMLTRKVLDKLQGPVPVVNTEVMGPGFQSAYGLVMAIHHKVTAGGGLFDNQIRTHGSVDYTSIARRFSHGCHRLVNTRAVRLFGFILRHRAYERLGSSAVHVKKFLTVDDKRYGYELTTRGYYYQLRRPIAVNVLEGRIMGDIKKPIATFVRKPGVDYGPAEETAPAAEPVVETAPVLGP